MARLPTDNRVRATREARGLSQLALAAAVGLSRQALGAIEAGRATPAVDVALRLARALESPVEALFGARAPADDLLVADAPALRPGARVALARIADRWCAHPLDTHAATLSADGLVRERRPDGLVIEPLRPAADARDNLLVAGCAPALGLLADRLDDTRGPGRCLWLSRSSAAALGALAAAQAHVAGVHLVETAAREPPILAALRAFTPTGEDPRPLAERFVVVTLGRWELGLLARPDLAPPPRAIADLARPGLRVATRERGAGAQDLLERALKKLGLPRSAVTRAVQVGGHLELAQAIALGAADTGIATRDAAIAHGLAFTPLAEERYDLVIPRALADDPRLARLLDALVSHGFRRELTSVGYDTTPTGAQVSLGDAS